MEQTEILVVDDDALSRTFCADVLRSVGHAVRTAPGAQEALALVEAGGIALVLSDIYMPDVSGLELLETVKANAPSTDVILMTGYATVDTAIRALKQGAADYLRKPFAPEELAAVVEATLARRRLYHENERLKGELRLYELSRSFNSVEDPFRVLNLGLEALLRVSGAGAGLCLFNGAGLRFMDLQHHQGFSAGEARAVRDALVLKNPKVLQSLSSPDVLGGVRLARLLEGTPGEGFRAALLLPLMPQQVPAGAFVLFRRGGDAHFEADDLVNARFLGSQVDLSYEAARKIQEARNLAFVDPLTDLHNARYLDLVLDRLIEEAKVVEAPFSVLFVDLDYFKEINDNHGHLTGGKVLIEVARILRANVRDEDTVIRYGGDEFTLVLPNTSKQGAWEVAERARRAIREHVFLGREGKFIHITASIGVATFPVDASRREELIDQADKAMYRGKEAARDVVYLAGT